jgi:putative ABC transport system permease protein
LTEHLAAIPGVTLVTASQVPAIAGSESNNYISAEGYEPATVRGSIASYNVVDPGYFRTMGMPMIAGREFTRADNLAAPKVATVNEAFVRQFLPGVNPIGRHMGRGTAGKTDIEIVGVVKDARYSNARREVPPVFYTPLEQNTRWGVLYYYVRTAAEPQSIAPQIRREVASLDPNLPIRDLKTMQMQVEENVFAERIMSTLSAAMAGLATVLAAIGLYGVLAFSVARRTREIGIRMALGANAGNVRRMVMREMLLILGIGTVLGLGLAAATMQATQSLLFGLKPWDAAVYAGASVALWVVAMAAAYIPARRATAVDPMVALRYE